MIWFTSDHHFGHENIIQYTGRPFDSAREMDQRLINNWNSVVKNTDTVYHLGDFTLGHLDDFSQYVEQLNGWIMIVPGGHDYRWLRDKRLDCYLSKLNGRVRVLDPLLTVMSEGHIFVLCHYAMRVWDRSHYGSMHLYGHSHGTLPPIGRSLDVGVDVPPASGGAYRPISRDEVIEQLSDKKVQGDER